MPLAPSTPEALRALIVDARASGTTLRIVAGATWLDAGRPVTAAESISTAGLTGVVEYIPGDLVLTVRAGTTLAEIARITAEHDQMLALDPFVSTRGVDSATIGATIATASYGPLAHGFGRARDLILGCAFVTGDGTAVRAGGRVVKNVAGFDLVRLTTGAWGTLGVITDVSLRLHARPAVDDTFVVGIDGSVDLATLCSRLNRAPLLANTSSLAALVVLTHAAPTAVRELHAIANAPVLLVARAMGNRTRVDAQRAALGTIGDVSLVDPSVWNTIRSLDHGNTTLRGAAAPSEVTESLTTMTSWCSPHDPQPRVVLEPLRGTVRLSCTLPPEFASPLSSGVVPERLPNAAWAAVPSPVSDEISQRLSAMFDPGHMLNPGILG